jgi:putative addiction module component (TIGR02574 family)
MAKVDLTDILELSVQDRISLAQQIWDSVASDPDSLPLTVEQREELERRLEEYRKNPQDGAAWEDVQRRLRSQLTK